MSLPTRAFLVDDERLALARLHRMLVDSGRIEIVGQNSDPTQALAEIASLRPAAIFLDIEMPVINGFELVARLPYEPTLVFTTAYDQYALKAFEVNSIDYLLKPIEAEDLDRALRKLERRQVEGNAGLQRLLPLLSEGMPGEVTPSRQRIASRVGQRFRLIDLTSVSHFAADDKLTYAVTSEGSYVVDATLNDLEKTLDPRRYQRIHRAYLVNLDFIVELCGSFEGSFRVRLKDSKSSELRVARDRVQLLKVALGIVGAPKK